MLPVVLFVFDHHVTRLSLETKGGAARPANSISQTFPNSLIHVNDAQ
jgi:hypothetical protein